MFKTPSYLYLILTLLLYSSVAQGQTSVSDFVVEFEVTEDDPTINQADSDFLSYAYKGNKMSMVLVNKMVDLKMVYDLDAKKGLLLNSMQSGSVKIASKLSEEYLAHDNSGIKITLTEGSKKIKGYACSKAQVSLKDKTIEVWYTPKLKSRNFVFEGYFFSKLDGFPLLMIETSKDGVLTSKATKITLAAEDNFFDQTIPEGYRIVSFEQLNGGKK